METNLSKNTPRISPKAPPGLILGIFMTLCTAHVAQSETVSSAPQRPPASVNAPLFVSPFRDYAVTRKECRQNPLSRDCATREKALKHMVDQLKKFCSVKDNRDDLRCESLHTKQQRTVPAIVTLCAQDPHARQCVLRKARARLTEMKRVAFCKKDPNHQRCTGSTRTKQPRPTVEQICAVFPERGHCQRLAEKRSADLPADEATARF